MSGAGQLPEGLPPVRAPGPTAFTALALAVELGLGVLALVLAWFLGVPAPRLELDPRAFLAACLATLPPVFVLFAILAPPLRDLAFLRRIRRLLDETLGPTLASLSLPQMALIALAAGVGEEMLFRGALQEWLGLFIAAAVFGLLHAFTPAYAALALLAGLYLGWLQHRSGNLLVPMVVHGLYDLVALWAIRNELRAAAPPELR